MSAPASANPFTGHSLNGFEMAGRIFQHPDNHKEIWINWGWSADDSQLYPPYEPALDSAGLSEANYNKLIEMIKKELEDPPFSSPTNRFLPCLCCLPTLGIAFIYGRFCVEYPWKDRASASLESKKSELQDFNGTDPYNPSVLPPSDSCHKSRS